MTGKAKGLPHEMLCWRINSQWAIRTAEWKLKNVKNDRTGKIELFRISKDLSETTNLAATHPEIVKQLKAKFDTWAAGMKPPQWGWQPHYCGKYRVTEKE